MVGPSLFLNIMLTKKNLTTFLIIHFMIFFFSSCSSSEETTNKKDNDGNDVYVFDEIPENDAANDNKNNANKMSYVYLIQIGAFESKINAEEFTAKSELKLGEKLDVTFNDEEKLYVVRFRRVFNTRNEAEKIRNELWQTEDFRDAWIIQKPK
jgi:cell division protein FtsN